MTIQNPYSFKKKLIAISVLQALSLNAATAATVTVDNGGDEGVGCTLREAVLLVSSIGESSNTQGCVANGTLGDNDIIEFSVPSVSGIDAPHIQITQDVSINPGGGPVSITGLGNDRIFNVLAATVSMDNLTISGGSTGESNTNPNFHEGGAGIGVVLANLTVTNSTISGNTALDDGGGIFIANRSFVRLIDSTVSGNTAGDDGGGIFIADNIATLSIENSSVSGNSAQGLGTNITATGNGGGLHATGGATVSITNSAISGNSAALQGGGIWSTSGTLSLSGATVSDNTSGYRGGGISARNGLDGFTISQASVVSGNESSGHGGGIYTTGDLTLTNSQVINNISQVSSFNRSGGGGGVWLSGVASLTLRGSTVSGNSAELVAGGIFAQSFTNPIYIKDSIIANNVSDGSVGGIGIRRAGTHTFDNVQITNNHAMQKGGGVYLRAGSGETDLTVNDSTISGNTSGEEGGGVYLRAGTGETDLTVNDSTISGNTSGEEGGGINVRYANAFLELNRTTLSANSATAGGGIYANGGSQTLSLNHSAVTANVSSFGDGGGINARSLASVSLNNSTISENSAAASGGGLRANSRNEVSIVNSTLADNSAQIWGGNLSMREPTFSLSNSIITGGEALMGGADIQLFNESTIIFSGGNLLGDISSTSDESLYFIPSITFPDSVILATSDGTQPVSFDDILSPLADNGGPTLTHALARNSPAIDVGDDAICATEPINNLDQRGETRPSGSSCDIGAYESSENSTAGDSSFFVVPLPDGKSVIFEL